MFERSQLKEGMTVRSSDGEKLGRVFSLGDGEFHIEKGFFFPKDYLVRYSDILDIRDGEIILLHGKQSLQRTSQDEKYETPPGTAAGLGTGTTATNLSPAASAVTAGGAREGRASEEVAIPVHKEELEVSKRDVQAGEVRVHKEVVEEEQTVSIPVRRERVRVERRDVTPDRPAMNASFQEETVVVPLHAEEVEVHKRPVVDEEVVIRKDTLEEERRVAEPVRHEEVDIRTSGEEEGTRSLNLNPDDPTLRRS